MLCQPPPLRTGWRTVVSTDATWGSPCAAHGAFVPGLAPDDTVGRLAHPAQQQEWRVA